MVEDQSVIYSTVKWSTDQFGEITVPGTTDLHIVIYQRSGLVHVFAKSIFCCWNPKI